MDLDINSNKGCSKDLQIKQEIVKNLEIKLDEERLVAKNLLRRQKVEFTQKTQIVQALLSEKYDSKQISEFHDKIVGTSSVWDNLNREKCVVLVPQVCYINSM